MDAKTKLLVQDLIDAAYADRLTDAEHEMHYSSHHDDDVYEPDQY